MLEKNYYIKYAKLLLDNPKGISDKNAIPILDIDIKKLNDIINYFESKKLIIRYEDEKAQSLKDIPKWKPGLIGYQVVNNASKNKPQLYDWLENAETQEKVKEVKEGVDNVNDRIRSLTKWLLIVTIILLLLTAFMTFKMYFPNLITQTTCLC